MSRDIYKIPRAQVDIEALAQEYFRYIRITAEDTEYLSYDPTQRDKVFAELYTMDGVKPDATNVEQFVADGDDPDAYLVPVNAEIARLTPPQTFKDRAVRLHLAFVALLVWQRFKFHYALADHHNLLLAVLRRKTQLWNNWLETEYVVLFPDRAHLHGLPSTPSGPILHGQPDTPPGPLRPAAPVPKSNTVYDADQLLTDPGSLVGKQFVHTSPEGQDEDNNGTWQVVSYSVRLGDGGQGVVHEYQVKLEAFGTAPIPMLREEVQHLLVNSVPVM